MGLLKIFEKTQSIPYKTYFGTLFGKKTPSVRGAAETPLATKDSLLHAEKTGAPGYSLNGNFTPTVTKQYNEYDDGVANPLPQPSILDRNGVTPTPYKNPEKP